MAAIPLVALLVATLTLALLEQQANARVARTLEVRGEIQTVLTLMVDAETGMRGYALSGQDQLLDPYRTAQALLPAHLARLDEMVRDRPDQDAHLRRVEALIEQRLRGLAALQPYGNSGGETLTRPPGAVFVAGKATMDALRGELGAMQAEEEGQFAAHTARATEINRLAFVIIAASALVGILGGLAANVLFTSGIARRIGRLEANADLLARGQPLADLPAGADEIGRLGRALRGAAELLRGREAALTESVGQLAAQTAALEAKTREQDAFVYTVAHDFRAPLVSVQGLAGMLAEDYGARLDGEGRRLIERIAANAGRLQALVGDLLDLAQIGRDERATEDIDLATVVAQAVDQLHGTLRARGAEVRVVGTLPTVRASRTRTAQLLGNLIDNAVKYTPADRAPLVQLEAHERGDHWELVVRDNGVGIPPAYREKVVGLFQRLPAGKALNPGGSGAGLAIVARIIEAQGGRHWIESEEGVGTAFHLTLPKGDGRAFDGAQSIPAGIIAHEERAIAV